MSFLTLNEKRAAAGYAPLEDPPPSATDVERSSVGRKCRSDQARAPAGTSDGGQWVDEGDGSGGGASNSTRTLSDANSDEADFWKPGAQIAQADEAGYTVNLQEEEAGGGHTVKYHVGKTDVELQTRLDARTVRTPSVSIYWQAESTFESVESANDLINRIIEKNRPTVDMVISGDLPEKWIPERFGYVTGKEAYRNRADLSVVM